MWDVNPCFGGQVFGVVTDDFRVEERVLGGGVKLADDVELLGGALDGSMLELWSGGEDFGSFQLCVCALEVLLCSVVVDFGGVVDAAGSVNDAYEVGIGDVRHGRVAARVVADCAHSCARTLRWISGERV